MNVYKFKYILIGVILEIFIYNLILLNENILKNNNKIYF